MKISDEIEVQNISDFSTQIQALDRATIPSGILSLPNYNAIDNPKFWGRQDSGTTNHNEFAQCLTALKYGRIDEQFDLPSYTELHQKSRASSEGKTVPMGLLHIDYHRLNDSTRRQFLVAANKEEASPFLLNLTKSALKKETVFICRPMLANIPDGEKTVFDFSNTWTFDNTGEKPTKIEFDPGDGKGMRIINEQEQLSISYKEKGGKHLKVKITYVEKIVIKIKSPFMIIFLELP